eukprot:TRINITY_DN15144_c0_g1_i1.p1 TRINITY_DN15144_c0_g1~~TRINITY_DN15144_c0_g1_i1.p1  ORF type:complete len:261 (+),score=53.26 TRINITY_DN15144_c0_g1_i1:102-785(+)
MANNDTYAVWSSFPGQHGWEFSQPECPLQMAAEPPGSTPVYRIMEEYAEDQTKWIDDFTHTFEKMMRNGYTDEELKNAPDTHTNLVCPMPKFWQGSSGVCYMLEDPKNSTVYLLGNRLDLLNGRVYQYDPDRDIFDFGPLENNLNATNQLWKISDHQLINEMTGEALIVNKIANFQFEANEKTGDFLMIDPVSEMAVTCWSAQDEGKPCMLWFRHENPDQMFYLIQV